MVLKWFGIIINIFHLYFFYTMNVYITRGNRLGKPFLMSIENKELLFEGQTEFQSAYESTRVTGFSCVCTQVVFDAINDNVGTINAPALVESVNSPTFEGRQNVYIENGSLKIIS